MMVLGAVGNAGLAAVVPVLTGDAFNAMLKPVPDTSVLIPLALIIGTHRSYAAPCSWDATSAQNCLHKNWNVPSAMNCIFPCLERA